MKDNMATLISLQQMDQPYYLNAHPIHIGEEMWVLMDNVDCQQITLAEGLYKQNKGHPDYRYRNVGIYTVDVLKKILVLTRDPENTKMHRQYIPGGQTQHRRRPGGKRTD